MPTRLVCLANSFKEGGRCLAGIELDNQNDPIIINGRPKWIRPICNTPHGEIPNHITEPFQILDVLQINNIQAKPEGYQSENVLFDTRSLKKIGLFKKEELQKLCEDTKYVFATSYASLSEEVILKLNHSLLLIKTSVFKVIEKPNEHFPDKPKYRLVFSFNELTYDLSITDPSFLMKYQKNPDILESVDEVLLSLSLGIKFLATNRYYKLVAGVIIINEKR